MNQLLFKKLSIWQKHKKMYKSNIILTSFMQLVIKFWHRLPVKQSVWSSSRLFAIKRFMKIEKDELSRTTQAQIGASASDSLLGNKSNELASLTVHVRACTCRWLSLLNRYVSVAAAWAKPPSIPPLWPSWGRDLRPRLKSLCSFSAPLRLHG